MSKENIKKLSDQNKIVATINQKIQMQNNQMGIRKKSWIAACFFALILAIDYLEIIDIHPALIMLSILLLSVSIIISVMFRSREKKLNKLISGESLIAEWQLTSEQKNTYVQQLFQKEIIKNSLILLVISFISIIVFGIFIAVIDDGKLAMLGILVGLILLLALFAYGMPYYYRYKNKKGDGIVLIGKKYAYVNGYFHNWDFPLSGIKKVKIIQEPFKGISLTYYYTDRTLKHSETLQIPISDPYLTRNLVEKLTN